MSVSLKCADHPKYKAVYPPKTACLICWKIYATKLRIKLKELKKENTNSFGLLIAKIKRAKETPYKDRTKEQHKILAMKNGTYKDKK